MDKHACIHLERSGGFAGISRQLKLDTAELPQKEANELLTILAQSDLEGAEKSLTSAQGMPDRFSYHLIVETDSKKYQMTFGESSVPSGIQSLFQYLNEKLRTAR